MSLRLVTPFINTNIPGAYPNVNVQSQPVGLGASGILVIIGEADGGPSYSQVTLANNSFSPDQLDLVQQTYLSGQIVDAFAALAAPSDDPAITGSANRVFIAKTNTSSKASAALASNYGTLSDSNYGAKGNLYQYQVISVNAEVAPAYNGVTIPNLSAVGGASFTVRLNGGVAALVQIPPGSYTSSTQVAAAATGMPSGMSITAGAGTNTLLISVNTDNSAWGKGYGKSFELYDSTPGDLAALGLVAGLTVSSQEPIIDVNIVRPDINVNQSIEASADIALQIGYQGTTATLSIANGIISTNVSGGSGANLSIPVSQFATIAQLAAFIASQTGYSAVCPSNAQQLSPNVLDQVSAVGIASSGAGILAGRIKNAAYNFQKAMATSALLFTPSSAGHVGLPAPMSAAAFLTGGARNGTAPADIVNVLTQCGGIQCNIIVPLFSQDAIEDITMGLTDSSSTYTIAAINALVKSHCIEFSTPALKKNRIGILSFTDNTENTYLNAKAQAQSLGNYRVSLCMQSVTQVNSTGVITTFQPWYASVLAAGMQTGGFYKAIVNKAANIISYTDPIGFDSGSPGDVEDALSAGLLFLSHDNGRAGYWVSDQTTYGFDANFVYNSIQAVYASDLIALDLAQSFFTQFVGQSLADVSASAALGFLAQKMDGYFKLKLIGASLDAPLGFKNAKISITAPEMDVSVEIKLATAIYFIPISINISQIQQSAG